MTNKKISDTVIIDLKNFDGIETSDSYIINLPKRFEKFTKVNIRVLSKRGLLVSGVLRWLRNGRKQ